MDSYSAASNTLERRRNRMHSETLRRKKEIYGNFPQIKAIDDKIYELGLSMAFYGLKQMSGEARQCARYIDELKAERANILTSNGYPADYTAERYVCGLCKDTGVYNGKACTCLKAEIQKNKQKRLSRASPFPDCRFRDFVLDYYPKTPMKNEAGNTVIPYDQMGAVLNYCISYAENFSEKSTSLMLIGRAGLGKTHLACSVANAVIEKGFTVLYCSSQSLFNRFEQTKYNNRELLSDVLDCDLFILDDLGAETMTSYTQGVFYNIVNTRMINRKPTIYTTNLTSQRLLTQRYSEKVSSRLIGECTVLAFTGKDIRQLKK